MDEAREALVARKSLSHRKALTVWKEAEQGAANGTGIDAAVEDQIQSESIRWRDILKRIIDCVKYLVFQNLALRGLDELKNKGNFLSVIKLVAKYDSLLDKHIQSAQ